MPIMTRMRDSMPIILFGLLIAFIITIIFEWGMDYLGTRGAGSDVVGEVSGRKISYQEFSEMLKNYADNQKAQTGVELDENAMRQAREQVWQSIVTQQVIEDEMKRMGITVTDQEILDWVRGENPPDDLRRNFIDSLGQFRKEMYDQFLANPNQFIQDPEGADPAYGTKWLANYEKSLRQRRMQEKLQSLVLSSVRVTPGELFARFSDQTQRYEATYTLLDANTIKDDEVQVSDAGLRSYYDENLELYKVPESRTLRFVQFTETSSASDSLAVKSEIEDVASKARSGIDFMELVQTYSDKPDSGVFFKHGELSPEIEKQVFVARQGDIIGPIQDSRGYQVMKILEERKSGTEYIHASHILFSFDGAADTNEVKQSARRVAQEAKQGKDFAELSRTYSKDPGSAQRGGDLGWFAKGRMVKPFEDAAFGAKPGQIVGPVRSPFGLHIIKVHAKDARELKVASIVIPIAPSSQTKNDIFERSRDFSLNARESDFAKEATSTGLESREAQVQKGSGVIPGIGTYENINRWAFEKSVGEVSDPFSLTNGYAVFTIAQATEAGVRPFDEVKESMKPVVLRKKKAEKAVTTLAEVRAKLSPGDSLSKAVTLRPDLRLQNTGSFLLNSSVPGIGRDLPFLGAVSALEVGQISQAIESTRGSFLIQLTSRMAVDSMAFTAQKPTLRDQILQEKRNRFLSEWLEKLKAEASIEDNRDAFFR
ncbi:MAG: peptidylprolyl isomerase [Bacteroidota bacterium]